MTKPTLLPTGSEWTFEAIEEYDLAIGEVARRYKLDGYPHFLEIISAEQMMDAYASIGMPVYYHHWSFGKHFLATENRYKRGQMGLAYEIVINSDPCIAYLMDENTLPMQPTGTTRFSKATICSNSGPVPTPSSTTWSSLATTSPSAKSATVSKLWSSCWMPAMHSAT